MPIYGLTHKTDGTAILRRSVTAKIAIGLPPKDKNDHPTRLDHFIFQKKGQRGSGLSADVVWEIDEEKTQHYGEQCRELEIILVNNHPDVVFRTEYAWWTATQKQCWGDGESATRRTLLHPRGEVWHPCANDGCPDLAEEKCRPSGDLYFILADYPTLGTICKLHTSSYQSIRELYAALEDIRSATGGRLMGLRVKLFVRPEKNAYKDKQGNRKSGTKHVLGLELAVTNVRQLPSQTIDANDVFEKVREQLAGRSVEIDDSEEEQAASVHTEFYPASDIRPAPRETLAAAPSAPESPNEAERKEQEELQARIEDVFNDLKLTTAQRMALIDQHKDDRRGLLDRLQRARQNRQAQAAGNEQGSAQRAQARSDGNGSASRPDNRRRER